MMQFRIGQEVVSKVNRVSILRCLQDTITRLAYVSARDLEVELSLRWAKTVGLSILLFACKKLICSTFSGIWDLEVSHSVPQ